MAAARQAQWLPDELALLQTMDPSVMPWRHVASHLPRHSAAACRQKWTALVARVMNTGRWTPEEDDRLRKAKRRTHNWVEVERIVATRR
ncbi:hypothetical protein SDRG_05163 [Saprolegnia diclina VS20]|uniref:Uncharacterized protein n=1 Tax=Saprolegnia diclina (strain VS20) TaxID=1156394 RepID=T0QU92_SAPDV|nr:hypothetical protein SDRG_05163 [Saprolegnia diclina VS20]EQC37565.1 hypothetical protein SDRG_05163 [Saprolegnia diclina VS20]|eukprot:XP_008609085.1 hypothetical protein SDRG_05163 [Saprolegnia diclina VS20]